MSTDIEVKLSMFAEKSLEMYYFSFMADRAVFIKNYVTCIIVKKKIHLIGKYTVHILPQEAPLSMQLQLTATGGAIKYVISPGLELRTFCM